VKLLTLDIETSPNLAYVWALFDQNVGLNQLVEVGSVICFAAKWYGEKKIHYHSDHHDGHEAMVAAAWNLIDEADAVIHYNGKAFDIKHLNREFVLAGDRRLSRVPTVGDHRHLAIWRMVERVMVRDVGFELRQGCGVDPNHRSRRDARHRRGHRLQTVDALGWRRRQTGRRNPRLLTS
jgi:hypothetical protein